MNFFQIRIHFSASAHSFYRTNQDLNGKHNDKYFIVCLGKIILKYTHAERPIDMYINVERCQSNGTAT